MNKGVLLPEVIEVRQEFPAPLVADVGKAVAGEMRRRSPGIRPGSRVAIAVGSRGIHRIAGMVAAVVTEVRAAGGIPFIVPAMGSHGGATAEGQRELLAGYGITEGQVGAPVISSMEVIQLGSTPGGLPVFCDRQAAGADGIILINRVKPHTSFHAPIESGLAKMLAIGLGKDTGAQLIHSHGVEGLKNLIPEVARLMLRKLPVVLGLAVIENAYDQTARVEALLPGEILSREPDLLAEARSLMPSLPFDHLDVLVVQEIGKNISGTGMDPAITGRLGIRGQPDLPRPRVGRLAVLDLTPETHGNAHGVGSADIITRRLHEKIDLQKTYTNALTAGFPEKAAIPLTAGSDREAVALAMATCGRPVDAASVRLVLIKNTLQVSKLFISRALAEEALAKEHVRLSGEWRTLGFDPNGTLSHLWT
ncbi:hypothetical protein SY88_16480 [Clostridiales bacterium PH28_bin88]|nr:hypothetical protein SY88_16480 [Clostridiales bacterium PH28_bin88]